MTSALTGIGAGGAALPATESPPRYTEPPLRNLWGLLTVQAGIAPDVLDNAQLEVALRAIDGTEVGAALLRAIASCDIAADERPVIAFDSPEGYEYGGSSRQNQALDDDDIIHFTVEGLLPDTASADTYLDASALYFPDALSQRCQAIDLFADLAAFYASRTGQCCLSPTLGLDGYSTLTFREQLGDEIPQWQRHLEAYIREPAEPEENRGAVWELVNLWNDLGIPSQPLRLNSLNLRECPPLRDVPGITWLILADNALTRFPPSDRLPLTLTRLDLAGNPIDAPADDYSPNLRHVTLDSSVGESTGLRGALPPHVQLVEVDADYALAFREATDFVTQFPETLINIMPIQEIEAAGWSNKVMARLYPKDMLESAAAKWFAPAFPDDPGMGAAPTSDAWQRAQQADPNGAAALRALLDRVHVAWLRQPDPVFRQRFTALLTKMCGAENTRFMNECLSIAREGAASCDDQILYTLNNLHIASLNADVEAGEYDHRPVELMHHAEDMLNVHTLTQFFGGLRPELQQRAREKKILFDEVEQYLHLHTQLQQSIHLPAMQFSMQFVHLSLVNDTDVQAARIQIRQARDTGFLGFLASWSPLQSVIRRIAPRLAERADQWRDHIYNDRGSVYGALDRLMKTDGRLFAAGGEPGMEVFRVGPRMFWTRYERLVDKRLAADALDRTMPDVLPQACRAVAADIQLLVQKATVRDFLNMHRLKLQQAIQDTDQPRWFKQLRKSIT